MYKMKTMMGLSILCMLMLVVMSDATSRHLLGLGASVDVDAPIVLKLVPDAIGGAGALLPFIIPSPI